MSLLPLLKQVSTAVAVMIDETVPAFITSIAKPPSINVLQSFEDNVNIFTYNAIPYLNAYYNGLCYGQTETYAYYDGTNPVSPNVPEDHTRPGGWPLDAFGIYSSDDTPSLTQSGTGGNMKGQKANLQHH